MQSLNQVAIAGKPRHLGGWRKDPPDHRDGQDDPGSPEEDPELVLAPAWIGLADRPDGPQLVDRPGRPAPSAGCAGSVLETLEAEPLEARQPAVDGRSRQPEAARRPTDVGAVGAVPVDQRQARAGRPAELDRRMVPELLDGRWGEDH